MILISEWLPNPAGLDTPNEWVEILNTGSSPLDLTGWRLTADGKKFFTLSGTIRPRTHVVLPRTETKITLRNMDGRLALYDLSGRLVDQSSFVGSAPEGESANRSQSGIFFGEPTPGRANVVVNVSALAQNDQHPFGTPLNPPGFLIPQLTGYFLGTALALTVAIVFILKSHEGLSHIFFQRDQDSGRGSGREAN